MQAQQKDLSVLDKPLKQVARQFGTIARKHKISDEIVFASEKQFALAALAKNDYLAQAAMNDPDQFQYAVLSAAMVGLSLNPSLQHAALIPRAPSRGKPAVVVFDPMYKGLLKLATDSGSISHINVGVVYEKDEFDFELGSNPYLRHKPNPFLTREQRGRKLGAYCVAHTAKGGVMIKIMPWDEVMEIKQYSETKDKPWSPWNRREDEMAIKTVIKSAQKTWPKIAGMELFQEAVHRSDQNDPMERREEHEVEAEVLITNEQGLELHAILSDRELPLTGLDKLCASYGIKRIADLPASKYNEAKERLTAYAEAAAKRLEAEGK